MSRKALCVFRKKASFGGSERVVLRKRCLGPASGYTFLAERNTH